MTDTQSIACPTVGPVVRDRGRRRFVLSPAVAFAGSALAFAGLYVAAGAPTPLLTQLQHEWAFPEWVLTIAFAIYAFGLLASLLVVGALSDFVGRRPVLLGALALELVAMLIFVFAPDIGWVITARALQGIATGAATSAFAASVVEHAPIRHKRLASMIGAVAAAGGLGLGSLFTGAALQFTAHASTIMFTALAIVMALGILVVTFSAETVTRKRGATRSLAPRAAVPGVARPGFVAATPVLIASWMLAGLFLGLGPTIVQTVFRIDSGFINGLTAFIEPAAAAIAALALGGLAPRRAIGLGNLAVLVGTIVIVGGVLSGVLAVLWIGGIIAGAGFGAGFSGTLRSLAPLAAAHERAELFAAIYVVAYLSFGAPAIVAGELVGVVGLTATVLGYAVAILLAAAWGIAAQSRLARLAPAAPSLDS